MEVEYDASPTTGKPNQWQPYDKVKKIENYSVADSASGCESDMLDPKRRHIDSHSGSDQYGSSYLFIYSQYNWRVYVTLNEQLHITGSDDELYQLYHGKDPSAVDVAATTRRAGTLILQKVPEEKLPFLICTTKVDLRHDRHVDYTTRHIIMPRGHPVPMHIIESYWREC